MEILVILIVFGFILYATVVERKIILNLIEDVFDILREIQLLIWYRPIMVVVVVCFCLFVVWWWLRLP